MRTRSTSHAQVKGATAAAPTLPPDRDPAQKPRVRSNGTSGDPARFAGSMPRGAVRLWRAAHAPDPALRAAQVRAVIQARQDRWQELYQDLHRHPELAFSEKRTAAKVAAELQRLGLKTLDIGGGVVAILENGKGPVSLVRAELDALPGTEATGLPYSSETPGVMHACGHDLHMTALIGTAEVMLAQKDKWKGTLVLVAQPAEEIVKGAQAMIDAGLFQKIPKPDHCLALHTRGVLPVGHVGFTSGAAQASADSIDVVFPGVSTHGAAPHRGVDPVIIAAEFALKMQVLVGREVDPVEGAVITIGTIHGGTKRNIVAPEVKVEMTMRTFSEEVRARLLKRIDEIARGLAMNARAPAPTVAVVESTPVLVNDPALTARFKSAVAESVGKDRVAEFPKVMTSDDFSLFAKAFPSLKFNIGTAAGGEIIDNHSPKFDPHAKSTLPLAVEAMVAGLADLHRLSPR